MKILTTRAGEHPDTVLKAAQKSAHHYCPALVNWSVLDNNVCAFSCSVLRGERNAMRPNACVANICVDLCFVMRRGSYWFMACLQSFMRSSCGRPPPTPCRLLHVPISRSLTSSAMDRVRGEVSRTSRSIIYQPILRAREKPLSLFGCTPGTAWAGFGGNGGSEVFC